MPIKADYHLHSSFSGDSATPMEDMIQKGIQLGLDTMCFTEHMDKDYPPVLEGTDINFEVDTPAYYKDFLKYKKIYSEEIKLLFGVELGLQPHLIKENTLYASQYSFDFIIGSSHICHGIDPYMPEFYTNRTEEEAYMEYFKSILENIKVFNNFDIYGHLDYVVRYGPNKDINYHVSEYHEIFDEILTALIQKGKGIEINTGGLGKGLKDVHPASEIVKRYKELGGEIITVGSDAHFPERIAQHFSRAEEVLLDSGFRYYTIFENRVPKMVKL